jgi:hypothetical protein
MGIAALHPSYDLHQTAKAMRALRRMACCRHCPLVVGFRDHTSMHHLNWRRCDLTHGRGHQTRSRVLLPSIVLLTARYCKRRIRMRFVSERSTSESRLNLSSTTQNTPAGYFEAGLEHMLHARFLRPAATARRLRNSCKTIYVRTIGTLPLLKRYYELVEATYWITNPMRNRKYRSSAYRSWRSSITPGSSTSVCDDD